MEITTNKNTRKEDRIFNISKAVKEADRDAEVLYDGEKIIVKLTKGDKK